jgi:hypothetical protein
LLHTQKALLTLGFCGGDQELHDSLSLALETDAQNRARFQRLDLVDYERRVYPFRMRNDTDGTADILMAGILHDGRRAVLISDFKYGRNKGVPASAPQLMLYGLGVMDHVGGFFDVVITQIIQPRLKYGTHKVTQHEHDLEDMHAFYFRALDALAASDQRDAPATPGDWCQWCLAKTSCPEKGQKITSRDRDDFDL